MFRAKLQSGMCGNFVPARKQSAGAPAPGGAMRVSLSAPVGFKGRNIYGDVVQVQTALVKIGPARGGQPATFGIDGNCGAKTVEAIRLFQVRQFGWSAADGLVEPGKRTEQRMNEIFQAEANAVDDFRPALEVAKRWIHAAQANLIAATPHLGGLNVQSPIQDLNRTARLHLLNKHFHIEQGPNRDQRFRLIVNTFDRMRMLFQRPGGVWGPAVFERDPSATDPPVIAFTTPGGYFKGGETVQADGFTFRKDSIYLCPLFGRLANDKERAFTIVHELAHFVGYPETIDDHAYNIEARKMELLLHIYRATNADCYANFASEAASGTNAVVI